MRRGCHSEHRHTSFKLALPTMLLQETGRHHGSPWGHAGSLDLVAQLMHTTGGLVAEPGGGSAAQQAAQQDPDGSRAGAAPDPGAWLQADGEPPQQVHPLAYPCRALLALRAPVGAASCDACLPDVAPACSTCSQPPIPYASRAATNTSVLPPRPALAAGRRRCGRPRPATPRLRGRPDGSEGPPCWQAQRWVGHRRGVPGAWRSKLGGLASGPPKHCQQEWCRFCACSVRFVHTQPCGCTRPCLQACLPPPSMGCSLLTAAGRWPCWTAHTGRQ